MNALLLLCVFVACYQFSITALTAAAPNYEELYNGIAAISPDVRFSGDRYRESADKRGFAYYGIKFGIAQRFEHSVANTNFSYLSDTSRPKQGYICPQISELPPPGNKQIEGEFDTLPNTVQNEDCLYLDVYVPPLTRDQNKLFPVMMWIYGGGLAGGDKDGYNSSILAPAIDAVVVTVNYRLFAFGFLSTGDEAATGNWGLGDLSLAVNWIEEHIVAFGGDPKKINIFGESAGGALTSALMLSEEIRGKVQAALAMSGSVFAKWAITKDPKSDAVRLAARLGCPTDTSEKLISCLKSVPFEQILSNNTSPEINADALTLDYAMVVDGLHIRGVEDYVINSSVPESGQSANLITWYLTEEASWSTFLSSSMPEHVFGPNSTIDYSYIKAKLPRHLINYVSNPLQLPAAAAKVMAFYNMSESDEKPVLIKKYIHFLTESRFSYGTLKESLAYAQRMPPLQSSNQFCLISYDSGFMGLGAFHTMDTIFIFTDSIFQTALVEGGLIVPEHVTKSFHDILREIAYNGRNSGAEFGNGQSQKYLRLNQAGQWVNEERDFRPITRFFDSLRELPYTSSAFSYTRQNYCNLHGTAILGTFYLFVKLM